MCQPTNIVRGEGYKERKSPKLVRSLCGGRPGDTGPSTLVTGRWQQGTCTLFEGFISLLLSPSPSAPFSALGPTASLVSCTRMKRRSHHCRWILLLGSTGLVCLTSWFNTGLFPTLAESIPTCFSEPELLNWHGRTFPGRHGPDSPSHSNSYSFNLSQFSSMWAKKLDEIWCSAFKITLLLGCKY